MRKTLFFCLLLVWPLVSSCAASRSLAPRSIRPVVKIGLLASFEGLHRRSGYEALAAMRLALDTYESRAQAIIPLAIHIDMSPKALSGEPVDDKDGTSGAWRTVQKLLADPDVKAVVGPYDHTLAAQIESALAVQEIPWFLPLSPDPTEADPVAAFLQVDDGNAWAVALIQDVARQAATLGVKRLVLAGWQPGWPVPAQLEAVAAPLPVLVLEAPMTEVEKVTAEDAIFWLGELEEGVAYLAAIKQQQRMVPFWFGQSGGEPVLPELLSDQLTFDSSSVYWVTLLDEYYLVGTNPSRSGTRELETVTAETVELDTVANIRSLSPTAYLTFRATQAAIASLDATYVPSVSDWQVVHFALQVDGTSHRLDMDR